MYNQIHGTTLVLVLLAKHSSSVMILGAITVQENDEIVVYDILKKSETIFSIVGALVGISIFQQNGAPCHRIEITKWFQNQPFELLHKKLLDTFEKATFTKKSHVELTSTIK